MTATKLLPRGIRNNNPLNIRLSGDHWQGMSVKQTDSQFCQFNDVLFGIRAAMVCMRNHVEQDRRRRVKTTVEREINRWAPASENNVEAYLNSICIYPHVKRDSVIDFKNKNQICCLLYRMTIHENGMEIPFNKFEKAYEML